MRRTYPLDPTRPWDLSHPSSASARVTARISAGSTLTSSVRILGEAGNVHTRVTGWDRRVDRQSRAAWARSCR